MTGTVGRIGIRVFPDLDTFNEKLKAGLEAAERKYKVEIPVRLKTSNRQLAQDIRDARNQGENVAQANNVKFRIPLGVVKDKETDGEIRQKVETTNARLEAGSTKFLVPIGVNRDALTSDLKAAINQAKSALSADDRTIKMILDVDKTRFERKFEELKNHYDGKEIDLKADVDRSGRAEAQLAVLSRNRYVDLIVRINQRSLATTRATLAALTGANILQSTGLALERFAMNIDRYAGRFAALGLLLTTVASSGLSLVSSMTGLFADIGKLGGFALALPTALGSITAFTVAGIMAFQGFKDAIGGSEEALAKLPDNARKAARALQGTWTAMQIPTQQAFWEQMGTAFTDLVDTVFPEVQLGLTKVGASSGKMFREVLRSFTDLGGDGVFAGMFDNLAQGIDIAARGIRPFMGALIELGSVGSQYLPQVGTWLRGISTTFADWVRRSSEAGKINLWMENASKAAGNLGQAFKNAGGALSAIVQGTRSAGSGNLETLADTMLKIRRTAESNVFQTGMANIFGGAHEAVQALQDSLGDLGRTLYVISPTIKQVLVDTGATVGTLLSSVAVAMRSDAFQNGLGDFFSGIRRGVEGLTRYAPRVVDALGDLGGVLGVIATEFGPVVGQVLAEVGDVFRGLAPAVKELIPVFANFAANSLTTLFTLLQPIADLVRVLIEAFNGLPGPIQTAVIALAILMRLLGGGANVVRSFTDNIRTIPQAARDAVARANMHLADFRLPQVVPPPAGGTAGQLIAHYQHAFNTASPAIQREYQRALGNALRPGAMSMQGPSTEIARQLQAGLATALAPGSMAWRGPTDSFTRGLDSALRAAVPAAYARSEVTQAVRDGYGNMLNRALTSPGMWNGQVANAIRQSFGQGLSTALGGAAISDSAFRAIQGNIATMTAGMFGSINRLSSVPMQNLGNSWVSSVQQAMTRVNTAIQNGFTGALGTVRNAGSALAAGFGSMWSLIGGGAGLALIGVFTVFSQMAQHAREVETAVNGVTQAYTAMGKAAADAGQGITGLAAAEAANNALDGLSNLRGTTEVKGLLENLVIGGGEFSFDELMSQGGFNRKNVVQYMQGMGDDGMDSFLKATRDKLDDNSGAWITRNFIGDPSGVQRDSDAMRAAIDSIITKRDEAKKSLDQAWQIDPQKTSQAVLKNISENISDTGKVTISNIEGIQKGLDGMQNIGTDKVSQFAAAMANSLGDAGKGFKSNFDIISGSLVGFGATAEQIQKKDYMRAITKDLVKADVPVSRIKRTLEEFGYSAEEAGRMIQFRFGPAMNSLNQPVTVLGEQIPKMYEFSDGIQEIAGALSTASGVDTDRLVTALKLGGADPTATARGLAEAGVAFSDIQRVMEAMGVPAATAAGALSIIRAELAQVNSVGFQQGKIAEYAKALDAIRTSADGAAGRATALLAAVDALNNEINTSANIQVAFGSALESVRKLGGEGSEALLNLSKAVDTSQERINFFAPGLETANSAFNNLAQTGLAAVVQAMRDSAAAGGDMNAQQAAAASVIDQQLRPTLDGLRGDLEAQQAGTQVTDQVWQQLLSTYHLTPEELITLAIAQTAGATTEIDMLIRMINGVPGTPTAGGPVVAVFDSLTQGAVAKASDLGIKVRQISDGRYELTMDADPSKARAQANGLVSYINGLSATVNVNINRYVQETATRIVREQMIAVANGGVFPMVGGRKPVQAFADGGLNMPVKYFARGGLENHRAQIAKAGAYRVWAEKETGGEAYIPLSPWKRNRSMQILKQVANIFGKQVVDQDHQVRRYSQGYAPSNGGNAEPAPMFHIDTWNQSSDTRPDKFAAEFNRRWQLYRR